MAVSNDEGEALETGARVTQESHHEAWLSSRGARGKSQHLTLFHSFNRHGHVFVLQLPDRAKGIGKLGQPRPFAIEHRRESGG
jgi:hypothetical protein